MKPTIFMNLILATLVLFSTTDVKAGLILMTPIGSWEMVSMDDKSVTEHLWQTVSIDDKPFMEYLWERVRIDEDLFGAKSVAELYGGDLSSIETKVVQNEFVFFDNGSWFWTLGLDMEVELGGGLALVPTMSWTTQGSYTVLHKGSDSTIAIVREDLDIRLEPENFWTSAGVSEADIKQAIPWDRPLGQVENWEARFDRNTLTLTSTDGIQHVLKREDLQKDDEMVAEKLPVWVNNSVSVEDHLESILKVDGHWVNTKRELLKDTFKDVNSILNPRATVTDSSKRLEELQRLKAEAEAELKHLERLRGLKVEIIEELTRLEELQRLKMKMSDELQQHDDAWDSAHADTVPSEGLQLAAWIDNPTGIYQSGDRMTVYCRVNQPAYVRLLYVLDDAGKGGLKYTLLHDSTHIDATQVGTDVTIGRFVATPPFGSEELIVLAHEQPFPEVTTIESGDGYRYLKAKSAEEAVAMMTVSTTRGMQAMPINERIGIVTKASAE